MVARVSLSAVPRVHPEAAVHRIGGKLMAATDDDRTHTFDGADGAPSAVAERIVELADGQRTVAQIAAELVSEFEVDRMTAERDTIEFLEVLIQKHVMVV